MKTFKALYFSFVGISVLGIGLLSTVARADVNEDFRQFRFENESFQSGSRFFTGVVDNRIDIACTLAPDYPQLKNTAKPVNLARFNRQMELLVMGEVNSFKKEMKGYADDAVVPVDSGQLQSRTQSYLAGVTRIHYVSPRYISADFVADVYYGGAHSTIAHTPLTFNFETGKAVELKDLFRSNSEYLKSLSYWCRKALHRSFSQTGGADVQQLGDGTQPRPDNYDIWALTPVGLLIAFGDYQVAPYAQGESQVLLPYNLLKPILKPEIFKSLQ